MKNENSMKSVFTTNYQFDAFSADNNEKVDANIFYFLCHEGKVMKECCHYALPKPISEIMANLSKEKPEGISDFDFMKLKAPEAYNYVYQDIHTWCNNLHLGEWGELVDVILVDFPSL